MLLVHFCLYALPAAGNNDDARMIRFVREAMESSYDFKKSRGLRNDLQEAIKWVSARTPSKVCLSQCGANIYLMLLLTLSLCVVTGYT